MPRQVEWLNANAYRRYPFVEDQQLVSGSLTMDDSVILDFSGVSYLQDPRPVALQSVMIIPGTPKQGVFTFMYVGGPAVYNPFSFIVPENAAVPYQAVLHTVEAHYLVCVFGEGLQSFLQNAPGTYVFAGLPQIEPALVSFQPNHRVTNIVGTGAGSIDLGNGMILLEEGHNCQIDLNWYLNAISISAIRGAGAGIDCAPVTTGVLLCEDVLLRINGMHGNDQGDFILGGGPGVEVIGVPDEHKVIIRAKTFDERQCGD